MRKIAAFSIQYPVTVFMVVLAILLLGTISFRKLGTDLFPDLNNPRIFVGIEAGEKPPEEIEKKFVDDMESVIMRLRGVSEVSSVTKVGSALLTIEYNWEQDMDQAFLDVQKSLGSFEQDDELDKITISRLDPNASPILLVAMENPNITDLEEMRKVAENYIRNEIVRLEGVADVKIFGELENEVVVNTNPYLLQAYGVTSDQIANQLRNFNQHISGGSVTEMGKRYIIKGNSLIQDIEDIRNIIVAHTIDSSAGTSATRVPVMLKNLATVDFDHKDPENIVRLDQKPCLGLYIYKENKYNTVKVIESLKEELDRISSALPGYEFTVVENQGEFIKTAISEVQETALMGILLAVFVLFIFLRRLGPTLIVCVAIPISIVATFNLMYFNHLTLNIMTLGGLALGAGMLVDNAIVVLENIFRLRSEGKSIKEAAIEGTGQVGGAITASTLTTIVVFLPIVYLHGASGELFKDQAWTVAFSLLSSLFVALFLLPVLYQKFYSNFKTKQTVKAVEFGRYARFLTRVTDKKYLVGLLALLLIGLSVLLVPHIGSEYFPKAQSPNFKVELNLPEGTRLERTASTIANIETIVAGMIGENLETLYSHVGPSNISGSEGEAFYQDENTGYLMVKIKRDAMEKVPGYMARLNATLSDISGMEYQIVQEESSLQEILGTEGPPVVVGIKGKSHDVLEHWASKVADSLKNIGYLYAVSSSVQDGAPEIEIKVDRYRAGIYNITTNDITQTLTRHLKGTEAGEFDDDGEMKDIIIKYPEKSIGEIHNIMIDKGGVRIPVTEVADITQTRAPKEIIRRDQDRVVQVSAWLKSKKPMDHVTADVENQLNKMDFPPDYTVEVTGEEQKRKESFGNLKFAMILSIILVYMVLASQFESLLHPFTILLTIPLAGVGSVVLFFIMGNPLNVMAYIGIIMLAGIAVNNSIILLDAINQYRTAGHRVKEAVVLAGQQRVRPIIMTSLTTILALLPLTFGFGESAALRAPMALAVIGGLFTSTLLTLIVIPCIYILMEDLRGLFAKEKAVAE
jgi:hydrophobic/amphiphilic exporter-1 (mainly G- bacteria), HAE1 family